MTQMRSQGESGSAANAVLVSLLRTLVDKELLSNAEVRAILTKAAGDLPSHEFTAPAKGAAGVILSDWLPQFPENGGD